MYTIEFQSVINNGVIIIPEEYKNKINRKNVKVIVLPQVTKENKKDNKFNAIQINTKGFKFNRENANAR